MDLSDNGPIFLRIKKKISTRQLRFAPYPATLRKEIKSFKNNISRQIKYFNKV